MNSIIWDISEMACWPPLVHADLMSARIPNNLTCSSTTSILCVCIYIQVYIWVCVSICASGTPRISNLTCSYTTSIVQCVYAYACMYICMLYTQLGIQYVHVTHLHVHMHKTHTHTHTTQLWRCKSLFLTCMLCMYVCVKCTQTYDLCQNCSTSRTYPHMNVCMYACVKLYILIHTSVNIAPRPGSVPHMYVCMYV